MSFGKEFGDRRVLLEVHSLEKRDPLSRLEVVKQLFEAFVNRLDAFDDFCVHLGLVSFGSRVRELLSLTNLLEHFRNRLRISRPGGTPSSLMQ